MDELDKATPYAIAVEEPKPAQVTEAEFTVGKWEVGLCGCCTHCVPNCLMVSCCPCVSIAQVSARLGMMKFSTALLICLLMILCTGGAGSIVVAVWIWMARQKTRERFQIPGGCCGDCLASCCCGCCALAQIATHTKSYKPGSCEFGPQDTLAAYQQA